MRFRNSSAHSFCGVAQLIHCMPAPCSCRPMPRTKQKRPRARADSKSEQNTNSPSKGLGALAAQRDRLHTDESLQAASVESLAETQTAHLGTKIAKNS